MDGTAPQYLKYSQSSIHIQKGLSFLSVLPLITQLTTEKSTYPSNQLNQSIRRAHIFRPKTFNTTRNKHEHKPITNFDQFE